MAGLGKLADRLIRRLARDARLAALRDGVATADVYRERVRDLVLDILTDPQAATLHSRHPFAPRFVRGLARFIEQNGPAACETRGVVLEVVRSPEAAAKIVSLASRMPSEVPDFVRQIAEVMVESDPVLSMDQAPS